MAKDIEYDDTELQRLFSELAPKRRLQAMKGAFRKEANKARKIAVRNLRGSVQSNENLEKGVRALVFKRKTGFRITVGTKKANKRGKGEAGFHTNRKGIKKPVLIWMEDGTRERKTGTRIFSRRKGHRTGRMKRYGFIDKSRGEIQRTVVPKFHDMMVKEIIRVSKRYGCK